MALVLGFERSATGALTTSSAAPVQATGRKRFGWAVNAAGAAHRVNATVALPAGAVVSKGRAYSAAGAVCFTTTIPTGANARFINGIRHHVNGAMFVKATAPAATARRSGHEKLLYDVVDGACFFDSVA